MRGLAALVLLSSLTAASLSEETIYFGNPGTDTPVPADYDGDGRTDLAVYRKLTGEWRVRFWNGQTRLVRWGNPKTDTPVPADYDGDGKCDFAVWRAWSGEWIIAGSTGVKTRFFLGSRITRPVPGDYDGDGKTDAAVFRPLDPEGPPRPNGWTIRLSTGGEKSIPAWGRGEPLAADIDKDGADELVLSIPSHSAAA